MIAPLLPSLAEDLSVSVAAAGQLVTVFALTYAVSSPILTALPGALNRRRLLVLSMTGFALANVFAFVAKDYWALMAARVLLALAADSTSRTPTRLPAPWSGRTEKAPLSPSSAAGPPSQSRSAYLWVNHRRQIRLARDDVAAGVGLLALIATLGLLAGLARDMVQGCRSQGSANGSASSAIRRS